MTTVSNVDKNFGLLVEKKIKLNKFEIVKYQLMNHCFVNDIVLNNTELNCLAYLGELGKIRLTEFSKKAAAKKILGSAPAVTNCVGRLSALKLICKDGVGKKVIYLDPKLDILSEGNVIIKLTLFKLEAVKDKGSVQKNSRATELA